DVQSDHSTVSKRHARLSLSQNGKLKIEDLGSANGTWRGRSRIQREAFGNGETVKFGSAEFRIELNEGRADPGASTVLLTRVRWWRRSGFDADGHVIQWPLRPKVDANGREVETSWIVGRTAERVDLVLADSRVSGEHAKIRYTPQRGLEICDLNSANG